MTIEQTKDLMYQTPVGLGASGGLEAEPPSRRRSISHPIARFVLRRLAATVATLIAASILIFLAVQALPGDVASTVLGRNATPDALHRLRADLGLSRPLPVRYAQFVVGLLHGDLGNSSVAVAQGSAHAPVSHLIGTPLVNSAILAGITLVLLIPLSLLFGTLSAVWQSRPVDHVISGVSLGFGAMPEFLVGTILVLVFFTWLDILPPISQIPAGDSPVAHSNELVLPVLTLLLVSLAFTTRLVRASTIDVLDQDYVGMARLNGVREVRVIWKYALRNALAPSVQAIAQTAQYLVGGVIIVESVFAYPGVGTALVSAVSARDVQMIMDITVIMAAIYVVINLVADLVVMLLVPRLRTAA
jgi:peptide/nickel transport system permease protein